MQVKDVIKNFEESNASLDELIRSLRGVFNEEHKVWEIIENTAQNVFTNCKAFNLLADSLQLVSDEKRLSEYELSDINQMYHLLVKYYPENVQYKIDQIEFLYRVMDKEEEAIFLIKRLMENLEEKQKYLAAILNEI